MNPWPFVTAAYVLTLAGTALLGWWSWHQMRDAEK